MTDKKEDAKKEELKKAAEVAQQGAATHQETVDAKAVLDKTAKEAAKAESFDHGKNDAGAKK